MKNLKLKKVKKGFTLIEVLLSMSLVAFVAALSIPIYQNFLLRNQLDSSVNVVVRVLKSAQNFAQAGKEDSSWGVYVNSSQLILFKGNTYASRDTAYDLNYDLVNVQVTGPSEIIYSKIYGLPNSAYTLNVSGYSNSKSIVSNAKGTINY